MMHLKLAVLKLLDDQPRSGYDLMKALQEQIGRKPSQGSVYPLLEQLKSQMDITCKQAGRRKVYTITARGKKQLQAIMQQKGTIIESIIEQIKLLDSCCGPHQPGMIIDFLSKVKQGKTPFAELKPELDAWAAELFKRYQQGKLTEDRHRIKKVIARATQELKRL